MISARNEEASAAAEVSQNQQDLADARRNEAEQAVDSAKQIAAAQQNVADAQDRLAEAYKGTATGASAAKTAQNAFDAAMAKLGPNQRKFVNKILDMRGEMQKFKNAIAEPMFGKLNTAFDIFVKKGVDGKNMLDVFQKGLTGTGKALGDTAIQASTLAANPAFQGTLAHAMDQNNVAIGNFGAAGVSLANVFVQLADAAGPLLIRFSEWAEKAANAVSSSVTLGNQSGELGKKISAAGDKFVEWVDLAKELWRWLKITGSAANDAAEKFGFLDKSGNEKKGFIPYLTDSLSKFNDTLEKNPDLVNNFSQALANAVSAGKAIDTVISPFLKLGSDPNIQKAFDKISSSGAFDRLGQTASDAVPALSDLVVSIADILATLSESGSMKVFLNAISAVAGWIAKILDTAKNLPFIGDKLLLAAGFAIGLWRAFKLIKFALSPVIVMAGRLITPFIKVAGWIGTLLTKIPLIGGAFAKIGAKTSGIVSKIPGFKAPKKEPAEEAKARSQGQAITDAFAQGIRAGLPEKDAAMLALKENVLSEFAKMAPTLEAKGKTVGAQVVDGLVSGIRTSTKEITLAGETAGREAAAAVAKGAQTASPSRLTVKTGDDIMAGLELGIKEGTVTAELAAKKAGASVARSVGTGATGAKGGVAAAGSGAVMAAAPVTAGAVGAVPPAAIASGGKFSGILGGLTKAAGPLTKLAGPLSMGLRGIGKAFTFMMGPWGMIAMMLIPLIMPLLKKLNDKFHIVEKVMGAVSWALGKLSDAFSWLWDNVLKPVWDWIVKTLTPVWESLSAGISDAVGVITGILSGIWDGIKAAWDTVFGWLSTLWDKVVRPVIEAYVGAWIAVISTVWDGLKAAWNLIFGWLSTLWEKVVKPVITAYVGAWVKIISTVWDGIKAAWNLIVGWLTTLWDVVVKPIITAYVAAWTAIITTVWDAIKTAWNTVVGWLTGLWTNIVQPIIQAYVNAWKAIISTVWDGITTAWNTVVGWLTGLWTNVIKPIIDTLVTRFKRGISRIWGGITEGWKAVSTWLSNLWTVSIKPKIDAIVNNGKAALGRIWNGIKDGWTAVGTWISNLWSVTIKPKIDTLISNMTGALKGIWNGMGDGLVKALNWVGDKVNWMIDKINSVLGMFGSKGITWRWPKDLKWTGFAEGGPVRGPGTGTSDSIPARLSNGEYVLPAKASKKLGPEALDYMRKYGTMPPHGGFGWDSIVAPFKAIGDAVASGAKVALQWVLTQINTRLGDPKNDNIITKVLRAGINWGADKMVGWGSNQDSQASPPAGSTPKATGDASTGVIRMNSGLNPLWNWPATRRGAVSKGPVGHGRPWATDFAIPSGTKLLAVASGVVSHAGQGTGSSWSYGKYVQIQGHPGGQGSLYAHMQSVGVKVGQRVVPGQILGLSDNTGRSTGPHLHFELRPQQNGNVLTDMRRKGIYIGMAHGGVVSPQGGGIMAMIGEAGKSERVTPLDREGFTPAERQMLATLEAKLGSGGGGDTYQIHPSSPINETALADLVARRVAWKRRRGAGR